MKLNVETPPNEIDLLEATDSHVGLKKCNSPKITTNDYFRSIVEGEESVESLFFNEESQKLTLETKEEYSETSAATDTHIGKTSPPLTSKNEINEFLFEFGIENTGSSWSVQDSVEDKKRKTSDAPMPEFPIGLQKLPEQRMKIASEKGLKFNLMIIGQSGLGKSTFINTLFNCDIFPVNEKEESVNESKLNLKFYRAELYEEDFKLDLTVVKYPGFSDLVNNEVSWSPMCEFIDRNIRNYMFQEEQPDRTELEDNRIHCCIYFMSPSNMGAKPLDIIVMRDLCKRVNVIPVIPKADGYTKEELLKLKKSFRKVFTQNDIKIGKNFEGSEAYHSIVETYPYTTIGSEGSYRNANGILVRGRQYLWGISEVENEEHCDFVKLRNLLMGENLLDLILSTERLYEIHRERIWTYRLWMIDSLCKGAGFPKLKRVQYNRAFTTDNAFKEVDYLPNVDGFESLLKMTKIRSEQIDEVASDYTSEFLHQQSIMKKKFAELVANQDMKFKEWKRALFEKQNEFNQEIEGLHKRSLQLQENIAYLSGMKSSSNESGTSLNIRAAVNESSSDDGNSTRPDDDGITGKLSSLQNKEESSTGNHKYNKKIFRGSTKRT
ncbi:septin [Saccharomycopsis crataegensis]|uniref:Septin n=1 Tax=Saccharomycopsis crataegensis TaxID=43959 RepID=A0AAV5QDN9_9ASCO|nr:septin [Saccharomycopsis crataegensis]